MPNLCIFWAMFPNYFGSTHFFHFFKLLRPFLFASMAQWKKRKRITLDYEKDGERSSENEGEVSKRNNLETMKSREKKKQKSKIVKKDVLKFSSIREKE